MGFQIHGPLSDQLDQGQVHKPGDLCRVKEKSNKPPSSLGGHLLIDSIIQNQSSRIGADIPPLQLKFLLSLLDGTKKLRSKSALAATVAALLHSNGLIVFQRIILLPLVDRESPIVDVSRRLTPAEASRAFCGRNGVANFTCGRTSW